MIISASRRTDIPALYSEWFMSRLRAGWCLVPNPFNVFQMRYVSLDPRDIDAVCFWSKNPAPMLACLDEMDRIGLRYYFQFTLNDYPPGLEPGIPGLDDRIETFLNLTSHIGQLRVVWRYDPNLTPFEYHRERFSRIAERLSGATKRVMVSFLHFYRKTERQLSQLERKGEFSFDRMGYLTEVECLLRDLGAQAGKHHMKIFTCANARDWSYAGIPPGRCIDENLINGVWGLDLRYRKDPGQRELCRCTLSRDIGVSDTCVHACPYCYSTRDRAIAARRYQEHNPTSPALWRYTKLPVGREAISSG